MSTPDKPQSEEAKSEASEKYVNNNESSDKKQFEISSASNNSESFINDIIDSDKNSEVKQDIPNIERS